MGLDFLSFVTVTEQSKAVVFFDFYETLATERYVDAPDLCGLVAKDMGLDANVLREGFRRSAADSMCGRVAKVSERLERAAASLGIGSSPGAFHRYDAIRADSVTLLPDALVTLERLAASGIRLGLISNASPYSIDALKRLRIDRFFQSVTWSCDIGVLKPDCAIYRTAMSKMALRESQFATTYFVGDGADNELFGAQACGLTTILIDRDLPHTDGARKDADLVISSLEDCEISQ